MRARIASAGVPCSTSQAKRRVSTVVLPGSGSRDNDQRAAGMRDGGALLRVEAVEEVGHPCLGYAGGSGPPRSIGWRFAAGRRALRARPCWASRAPPSAPRLRAAARAATPRWRSIWPPRTRSWRELEQLGAPLTAVSEERGEVTFRGGGPTRVVIDPVDGSLNAKRGLPVLVRVDRGRVRRSDGRRGPGPRDRARLRASSGGPCAARGPSATARGCRPPTRGARSRCSASRRPGPSWWPPRRDAVAVAGGPPPARARRRGHVPVPGRRRAPRRDDVASRRCARSTSRPASSSCARRAARWRCRAATRLDLEMRSAVYAARSGELLDRLRAPCLSQGAACLATCTLSGHRGSHGETETGRLLGPRHPPPAAGQGLRVPRATTASASMRRACASGSPSSRSRPPGRTSGSAPTRTATSRPPGPTPRAASSTATTTTGASAATGRSSRRWRTSPAPCRACAVASSGT